MQNNGVFDAAREFLDRAPMGAILQNVLLPGDLERAWLDSARPSSGIEIFSRFLHRMDVRFEVSARDLERIPATGPVVLVANHPFGLIEGAIGGALAARVRPDVRILANSMLAGTPGLDEFLIPVDPFGGAARANWKSLRASLEWLRRGGLLVTFPAGEVSSLQLPKLCIADPAWNENVARMVQISGAASVPVFFHGTNGPGFHFAGLIHPRIRTALLGRELLNKRGRTLRVSVGRPISAERVAALREGQATDYLWHRTYLLQSRAQTESEAPKRPFPLFPRRAPVAGAVDAELLRKEAEGLDPLLECGDYSVYVAGAGAIPNTLREIGRLREISFRAVGEGTGRSLDLDRFDRHYLHLWIWNRKAGDVVGAYRLAGTDTLASPRDLYTSTLFRFRPELLDRMRPALELGRSFVRPEYQRSYVALLLLWKGIGQYVARNPRYRFLFGPVSISRDYSAASRSVMVSFLKAHCGNPGMAGLVEPKRPFRSSRLRACDLQSFGALLSSVDELSEVVADLERDGKGIPVLLRQYLSIGGQILAFNVDAEFADVLDGLVMVDLTRMQAPLLEKYLCKPGAAGFVRFHNLSNS
jgi:putative hemolysin